MRDWPSRWRAAAAGSAVGAAAAVDGTMAANTTRVATVIDHLDHLVLTTIDAPACIDFYTRVLGMRLETFAGERQALRFGNQKINIHRRGHEYDPRAHLPVPGALDLCFIADRPLDQVIERLGAEGVAIVEGPVLRTGATHKLRSVYVRDPDLNLIEISELMPPDDTRRPAP